MKNGTTELVFLIDRSGSMSGLEEDTIGGFNAMLREQRSVEGEALVTTVLFDDQYELLHDRLDLRAVPPLTREAYSARGSTALLDAVGTTIHRIRRARRAAREEGKVLFVIITDGQENASRRYTAEMIRERIEHQREKYGWEFVFFGANMDAVEEAARIGIAADRARNYQADAFGTRSAYTAMSAVSTSFRTGAPSGDGRAAFLRMKEAVGGLKESADRLAEELSELAGAARANGGRIPAVNEILRRVLSERDEEEKR